MTIINLLEMISDLSRFFFRDLNDNEIEELSDLKRVNDSHEMKINFMSLLITESIDFQDTMMKIALLRKDKLFAIVCSIILVYIEDVRAREPLDSETKINCMTQKLVYKI